MQGVDCCTYHLILQISTKLKNAGLGSKVEFVNFWIGVIACEMQSRMFYVLCPNRLGGCYILDNASFHKKKDILSQISAEMPHII
jgi:hypothetical protein